MPRLAMRLSLAAMGISTIDFGVNNTRLSSSDDPNISSETITSVFGFFG